MPDSSNLFREAVRLHQLGELARAEDIYRRILASAPQHADALHLLGVTELQRGRHQAAADLISRAIILNSTQAEYHYHLGLARSALGLAADARLSFLRALSLDPERATTHYQLGLVEQRAGDLPAAAAHYARALQARPDMVEARVNLGDVLRAQGKLNDAAAEYRAAARIRPECIEARHNLGAALVDLECFEDAANCLAALVTDQPQLAEGHYNLGRAFKGLGRAADAQASFRRAIQLRPEFAIAHYALANIMQDQGELDAAADEYRQALAIDPNDADALTNYGKVLHKQGNSDQALDHYNRAIELKPGLAAAHFSRAMILLRRGDFSAGWNDYEWRVKLPGFPLQARDEPLWDGSTLSSQTLLVHAEQGLGDTLQFIRYLPLLNRLAPDVVAHVQDALVPLLRQSGFHIVGESDPVPHADVQVPLLTLPKIFSTNAGTVPNVVPYLEADRERVKYWQGHLNRIGGFKIGIAWQGNPKHVADRQRSFPLKVFSALASVPNVRLVSLQKDHGIDQIAECKESLGLVTLDGLDGQGGAFLDTAAVMSSLDLMVTSDTAIAHLAGALGARVWVALAASADWRWLENRDDSPWYPTMRLFRQSTPGDWPAVFERMAAALQARMNDASQPL